MIKYRTRSRPKNLGEFITTLPLRTRGIATEAAAEYLLGNERRGLRYYPRRRPKQKYVRTFKLRNGWQLLGEGAKARVENNVPYAPFVQGERQAWMHAGRWRPYTKVAEDNTKGMIQAADRKVQKYIMSKSK
jgi:hypothetical protein